MGETLLTLAHGVGEHLFLVPVSSAAGGEIATAFGGLISRNVSKRHYFSFLVRTFSKTSFC